MSRNRQRTELKIHEAALRVLKESGFEGWGVNVIAREAGVDKVLLYRYFNSLEGLLESIISSTDFWPDPENLPADTPMEFIEETVSRMRAESHASILLSHPRFAHSTSSVMRRFSTRRDNWMSGFMGNLDKLPHPSFAEQVSALVFFWVKTGLDDLSLREFLKDVEWQTEHHENGNEELPVELL